MRRTADHYHHFHPLACTFTIGSGRVHRVFVKLSSLPLIRINRRAFSNYCITNKIIIITAIPQLIKRFSAPNNFRLCRCLKAVPSSGCCFFESPKLTRLETPTCIGSFCLADHQATALSVIIFLLRNRNIIPCHVILPAQRS